MRLSDFSTLIFDCYGTLIDWETGMIAALKPLTDRLPSPPSRNAVLQAHARHESEQQRRTPTKLYRDVLAVVYRRLAEDWDMPVNWDECVQYGASVGDWPAFPDTVEALAYLKQHYRLVILSNVDNASFAQSNRRLGVTFDAVFTAEDTGAYKPSLVGFHAMLETLATRGIPQDKILHTAESLFHDHGPANALGIASCWIHRRHAEEGFGATMDPGTTPRFDCRFTSMAALAEAHRRELAGD